MELQTTVLRRVKLEERHASTGQTRHTLVDQHGSRPFAAFTSLEVVQFSNDPGYYLMHICEDGSGTDTYHSSLEDAFHQADFEFSVKPEDWSNVNEVTG